MRYRVVPPITDGFDAAVVDTAQPNVPNPGRLDPVCECHDWQAAEIIAAALNEYDHVESPAQRNIGPTEPMKF